MPTISIGTLITECQQELAISGTRVSNADFILFADRSNEYFMTGYKMPTTERLSDLLIFPKIYEYELPSDFAGIMPPQKPLGQHSPDFTHETSRSLTRWQYGKKTAIKYARSTPYLVVQYDEGTSVQLHSCDDFDANGTWSISGDGSAIADDTQIFVQGSASMSFTITASGGTTTLVNSTISSSIDITDYLTRGYLFLNLQCPTTMTTAMTSVRVRIGSDASNYYQMTSTERYRGDSILDGWGPIGFSMGGKSTTGTPTDTAIDYIQILLTHTSSSVFTGTYRIDDIFLALPEYFQLPYYSSQNILATDGTTYKTNPTLTSDQILVPVEFKSAYVYKMLELAAIEKLQDQGLANYFQGQLQRKEQQLKAKFPAPERYSQNIWYKRRSKL